MLNARADVAVANDITHSIPPYNIIIIQEFLLVIEMRMHDRVIFPLAENYIFDPNSAVSRALGLHSLLSHSFTLNYLTLE
jgi:hypothetical protein